MLQPPSRCREVGGRGDCYGQLGPAWAESPLTRTDFDIKSDTEQTPSPDGMKGLTAEFYSQWNEFFIVCTDSTYPGRNEQPRHNMWQRERRNMEPSASVIWLEPPLGQQKEGDTILCLTETLCQDD